MSTIAIVGAGPQLGLAIGRRFAAEGFRVALIARRKAALDELVDALSAAGAEAAAFAADVTDRSALQAALEDAERHFGAIDVLEYSPAPSAADLADRPLIEASEVTVESVIDQLGLYLYGGITAVRQVLPGMLERGSGTIIATTGAGSGPMIIPQFANSQIAAAGLRNYLLSLNAAVAEQGVHVAHVALAAAIGQGRPGSEPDVIADAYWRLHRERTEAELFYYDLPEQWEPELSDKFRAEPE